MKNSDSILQITSEAFSDEGYMPKRYTGFGEDVSPPFCLLNLSPKAVSVAIIMNDLDIPMVKEYTHWLIWNIPPQKQIPENIPYGHVVQELGNAVQGTAYGKNRYRGPKQPIFIRNTHRYVFRIYTLDCFLKLRKDAGRKELLDAIKGHVIQEGSITGRYKR